MLRTKLQLLNFKDVNQAWGQNFGTKPEIYLIYIVFIIWFWVKSALVALPRFWVNSFSLKLPNIWKFCKQLYGDL